MKKQHQSGSINNLPTNNFCSEGFASSFSEKKPQSKEEKFMYLPPTVKISFITDNTLFSIDGGGDGIAAQAQS